MATPTGPEIAVGRVGRVSIGRVPMGGKPRSRGLIRCVILAILLVGCSVAHLGWPDVGMTFQALRLIQVALLLAYFVIRIVAEVPKRQRSVPGWFIRQLKLPDLAVASAGLVLAWWWPAVDLAGALLLLIHAWTLYLWLLQRGANPGLIFVISFAVLIFTGTGFLMMPAATPGEQPIRVVDALFTATSASCVTGLTIRDTNLGFTRFGQVTILVLIQLGGLGTILFGALVALLLGSSLSLKAVHALADTAASDTASADSVRKLVVFAGAVIFSVEAIGAALLYAGWPETWALAPSDISHPGSRAFHAVFHSISAFCNAGFATSTNSLESLRSHWTSHLVIAGLIIIGGLGLPLYVNFAQIVRARLRGSAIHRGALVRLSLHSRIVLIVTLAAYLIGAVLIFMSQYWQRDVPAITAALDGHFMSVSARTAGFDTVIPSQLGPLARFTLMISMFIGGSPSSTAGGIKTVVAGTLVLIAWAAILDRKNVQAFGRSITGDVLRKSATLLLLHLLLVMVVAGVLTMTEAGRFAPAGVNGDIGLMERMVFESISACSTVGLTLDTSAGLSDAGKVTVSMGMFLGRVGSLAFLVALVGVVRRDYARYEYPTEGVVLT